MALPKFKKRRHPAQQLLEELLRFCPFAYNHADSLRTDQNGPKWPPWCYLPSNLASSFLPPGFTGEASACLLTWGMCKGIYSFPPDLLRSITDKAGGNVGCPVPNSLPEWAVYIETPGLSHGPEQVRGFFACLDFDAGTNDKTVILLLDSTAGLLTHRFLESSAVPSDLAPFVALLGYLCSNQNAISGKHGQPGNPAPVRTRDGWQLFPFPGLGTWKAWGL